MLQSPPPEAASVLVIDDEPQIVAALSDLLEDEFRIVAEGSPEAALERLGEDKGVAAIVCDQRMPRMTGDQFFAQAKDLSMATRVLITGYADLEVVVRAVNAGKIFGYITKPWDPEVLMATVRNAVEFFALNRALWQERALLSDLMRSIPDAVAFKDSERRYLRLNEAEATVIGLARAADAVGKTLDEIAEDPVEWSDDERDILATGKPALNRLREVARGGERRWYSANIAPVHDLGGAVVGLVGVTRDVTEEKEIQKVKDEFVATVSHELRTPLTSIQGSLALMRGGVAGPIPEEAKGFVEIGYQNCGRLLRLINDILDLEKLDKGEMRIELEPQDLEALLAEAVAANADYGRPEGKEIELAAGVPSVRVNADRDRFLQVMANLISNAFKFSPQGGKVRVRAGLVGEFVRVSVTDRGPGIPKEFRKRIFQRFSQADASDARRNGGAGLGLSIARSIVALHGGRINYRTRTGVGTKFYFELPVVRD